MQRREPARAPRQRRVARALVGALVAVAATGTSSGLPIGAGADAVAIGRMAMSADAVADEPGGIAARLRDANGTAIPGHVFLLIGLVDTSSPARAFDATPYTHDGGTHPDTVASNIRANETVREITGTAVELIEMTNGPGGGPSGGLARAIAYLNVVSGGGFSGDIRIAATGELSPVGQVRSIDEIDAKTVAAELVDADVLFTPTLPSSAVRDAYGDRVTGESFRDPETGKSFNDPRRVEQFEQWGARRPAGMDIVDVRHLIDVSAYLCGSGSDFACDVTDRLDQLAQQHLDELTDEANEETTRFRAAMRRAAPAP